jgi:polar amino acid transport system substrate-binding protein
MQSGCRFSVAILGLLIAACAGISTQPTPEARQVLAPTGKLRVAVTAGSAISMIQDPASGQTRGVTYELGQNLAERLGVPFEPVVFARPAEAVEALKSGKVDLILTNATPVRARDIDFTPALLEIEQGFLAPPGSSVSMLGQVDRAGIQVGVTSGSTSEGLLSRELKNARLVPVPNFKSAIEMLLAKKLDVFATNKTFLFEISDQVPGSRVLDGSYGVEQIALGIPKGRDRGMAYVRQFVDEAKSTRLLAQAVERAGLRGTAIAR